MWRVDGGRGGGFFRYPDYQSLPFPIISDFNNPFPYLFPSLASDSLVFSLRNVSVEPLPVLSPTFVPRSSPSLHVHTHFSPHTLPPFTNSLRIVPLDDITVSVRWNREALIIHGTPVTHRQSSIAVHHYHLNYPSPTNVRDGDRCSDDYPTLVRRTVNFCLFVLLGCRTDTKGSPEEVGTPVTGHGPSCTR